MRIGLAEPRHPLCRPAVPDQRGDEDRARIARIDAADAAHRPVTPAEIRKELAVIESARQRGRRPASAKATAARRSFSEGGSGAGRRGSRERRRWGVRPAFAKATARSRRSASRGGGRGEAPRPYLNRSSNAFRALGVLPALVEDLVSRSTVVRGS